MKRKSWRLITTVGLYVAGVLLAAGAWGATFGTPVAIGGHASDIALDEVRGVLYIANFTANRIDVMSLADLRVQTSMNVGPQPGSLSLSPDGRYLVVAHYGNFEPPASSNNALTVIDLVTHGKRTFALGSPPLGVAFGRNERALVVTSTSFLLFHPMSGSIELLGTISDLATTSLPVPPANFPPNIISTSLNVSSDGRVIYGLTNTFEFGYDMANRGLRILGYTSSPDQGPRVVSVNHNGSRYLAGWVLHGGNIWNGTTGIWNIAQFPNAEGVLEVGGHAIDDTRGLVYAQVTTQDDPEGGAPTLEVLNGKNLAILEKIRLPENLAGKSLLSADGSMMYSISDSGVMALPVGQLPFAPKVLTDQEQLLFSNNFCDRAVQTKEFIVYDRSGGQSDFSLSVNHPGVQVTPQSGVTPATITVRVDPSAFGLISGTAEVAVDITSRAAVNMPKSLRVLVNEPDPDQRGTVIGVPGTLVDILPDPIRNRFYVLRQDTNQVLVFDGTSYSQIATLATGNVPTQMAITFDRRWLLVGHDNSQYVAVFDLETLEESTPILTPGGHYPRSVAASGSAILTANRVAGVRHTVDRIDFATRSAHELPTLGVYENDVNESSILVGTPNGSAIFLAMADGNVMLYDSTANTFTVSRRDAEQLGGAYAASALGQFVVGDRLMNASLVTRATMDASMGTTSGFVFVDDLAFRVIAPETESAGIIERVDVETGQGLHSTRMAEKPVVGDDAFPFTRTLAPLYSRQVLVALTTSGITILPWNFDASVAPPRIGDVVNAADYTDPVAPGGLVSIFGENLSPTNEATSQIPLPTALGDSCLTVNGIPMPVLFVSPNQINAQLPFETLGNTTLVLRTPGGVSDNYNMTISVTAPAVFQRNVEVSGALVPTIVRAKNNQLVSEDNPIHQKEDIIIYLTGMGRTFPEVEAGAPSPSSPLAEVQVPVEAHIAETGLPISYAGLAPGQVGVYQINAHVPWWTPKGDAQPLIITQGSSTQVVYVPVVKK